MKLREKFLNANEDICEIIANDFAIGFTEWILKNYDGVKSIKQLLEIYKKENDL